MVLTVKVKVGAVGAKGLWGVIPNGGLGSGVVFQPLAIRVILGGEGIAGALVALEWRRPFFGHDGGGRDERES